MEESYAEYMKRLYDSVKELNDKIEKKHNISIKKINDLTHDVEIEEDLLSENELNFHAV